MDYAGIVKGLIESAVTGAGYILDDVFYIKEGANYFLRVVIDKCGVITVDDCSRVTRIINPILDSNDPISENYILDVCSKERGV